MSSQDNVIRDKSYEFALRIVKLYQFLVKKKRIRAFKTNIEKWDFNWSERRGSCRSSIEERFFCKNDYCVIRKFVIELCSCISKFGEINATQRS